MIAGVRSRLPRPPKRHGGAHTLGSPAKKGTTIAGFRGTRYWLYDRPGFEKLEK